MRYMKRITASAALVGVLSVSGCGNLLDVENPNNLTEDAIQRLQAAAAVVNGSEALVYSAVSQMWLPLLTTSDDLFWGADGSRDAWGALDQGQINDPVNEFVDAYFPTIGQARWLADEAIGIIDGHVSENPGDADLVVLQARANLYAGIIYMLIGEVMQDFAFSDKQEEGPAVGAANMDAEVFGPAITYLSTALSIANGAGETDLALAAQALRARAHHARGLRAKIQPTPNTADPLVNSADANADAAAVIAAVPSQEWRYEAVYNAATITNTMASWVNSRGEPLIAPELDALQDPIDNIDDPAAAAAVGRFNVGSDNFTPLTLVSARQMHLILAEAALQAGGAVQGGTFTDHINNLRGLDGLTPFSGQIPAQDLLVHSRRANLAIQGQRLADMYRFDITDPTWLPNNTTSTDPGFLVPIGCVELRANTLLDDSMC